MLFFAAKQTQFRDTSPGSVFCQKFKNSQNTILKRNQMLLITFLSKYITSNIPTCQILALYFYLCWSASK